jgi:hypothetical protein
MTKVVVEKELRSGLILAICKNPKEFFEALRDDIYSLVDERLQNVNADLNTQIQYEIMEYFVERFGI